MFSKSDNLKKKKKKDLCSFSYLSPFPPFPFQLLLLFLNFPLFPPFFLSPIFPGRSAKISRWKMFGGTLPPPLPRSSRWRVRQIAVYHRRGENRVPQRQKRKWALLKDKKMLLKRAKFRRPFLQNYTVGSNNYFTFIFWLQFQVFEIAKFEFKVIYSTLWPMGKAKCTQLWPLKLNNAALQRQEDTLHVQIENHHTIGLICQERAFT